ncbi:hypothetical protein AAZX31_11G203100 [Glycine max]
MHSARPPILRSIISTESMFGDKILFLIQSNGN